MCMPKTWRDTYSTLGHGGHFWTTRATCHTKRIQKRGQDARPSAGSSHASHSPTYRGPCKRRWTALGWTLTACAYMCDVSYPFVLCSLTSGPKTGFGVLSHITVIQLHWIGYYNHNSVAYHMIIIDCLMFKWSPMVHMAHKYHETLRRWSAIVWWLMVPPICCWNALCSPAMCAIQMYAVLWINPWSWVASKSCDLPVKLSSTSQTELHSWEHSW